MSFRSRLLLCIVGMVIGSTAVSLLVAQRQNQQSYRAVVDEMFRREVAAFQRQQAQSLAVASAQAARLASSVRLFAALEAEDESVYQVASDEMRLGDFSFFRLASTTGGIIPPPIDLSSLSEEADVSLRAQLEPLPATSSEDTPTSIGFVLLADADGEKLFRVLLSPIFNFDQHMGWLVLGQQVELESHAEAGGAMQTGVQVNGRLCSATLPDDFLPQDNGTSLHASAVLNASSILPEARLVTVFSLTDFHDRQRALMWRIAGVGVLAILLSSGIAFGFAKQLAEPIRRMVDATVRIKAGKFNINLPPTRTHELNALSVSLTDMATELELKERYHSVLQMVADPQVADELIHGGLRLGGEMREVSILFCDVRGYTSMSVGMDPAEVISLLNEHMSALTRIVHARKGVVKQFTGDGIMILFGAPKSYGCDALDAAHCAVEMMRERLRLNDLAERPMRIGIGIATGIVVAGGLGAENRAEYTVVGERVNLAARLCSAAAADEILIDEATMSTLPPEELNVEPIEALSLKGYSRPIPAWRLHYHPPEPATT